MIYTYVTNNNNIHENKTYLNKKERQYLEEYRN
jgi:hypothetical protein